MTVDNNNRRHRYLILLITFDVGGIMSNHEFMMDSEYQYVTKRDLDKCKEILNSTSQQLGTAVVQSVSYLGFTSKSEFHG
ncbi:hypothetical protein ACU5EH_16725 [Aliivibrio salmonicida]|uniref:hypothetical protein n=1 Tax=Aliivibrio salmonicida TaxID=40269 RepID=UPI00406C49ED